VAAWQRDTEHIEKSLVFGGFPARNGVSAALLIQLGGTGVEDILSGPDNFLMTLAPKADPRLLAEKLGERFAVTETNIKKWTVGSPIQAPLDAIENLRKRRPFEADDVRSVVVRVATSEARTVNGREMPDICLQHMVAVMLIDKTASFEAAHDKPRMQDAAILRQRAKVQLVPDEELERLYPRREAIVEITFADGTRLTERVSAVRGTADNPMTREEVAAARDLLTPLLNASGEGPHRRRADAGRGEDIRTAPIPATLERLARQLHGARKGSHVLFSRAAFVSTTSLAQAAVLIGALAWVVTPRPERRGSSSSVQLLPDRRDRPWHMWRSARAAARQRSRAACLPGRPVSVALPAVSLLGARNDLPIRISRGKTGQLPGRTWGLDREYDGARWHDLGGRRAAIQARAARRAEAPGRT
jgi:hypothetical protein